MSPQLEAGRLQSSQRQPFPPLRAALRWIQRLISPKHPTLQLRNEESPQETKVVSESLYQPHLPSRKVQQEIDQKVQQTLLNVFRSLGR